LRRNRNADQNEKTSRAGQAPKMIPEFSCHDC
jgi:hypothetical protein